VEEDSIKRASDADRGAWDEFVRNRQDASLYHLYEWRDVIEGAYGLSTHYLMLTARKSGEVLGVLPLVHLKHFAFGNQLVSMPFADGGGILARSTDAARLLASGAERIASGCGAEAVELRQEVPLAFADEAGLAASGAASETRKVRMLLGLPGTPAQLARGFKSKLRSQINRPLKEGCSARSGGLELLEDFYKVFLINMRDLGSPVHSKELMRRVLEAFPERSRIFAVYHGGQPVAASLVIGFNGVLRNPWAASDRRYAAMSPNMLLYSRMLEFACDHGYRIFDFGRSTPGEGTYRFKAQWGAVPAPLHWYVLSSDGTPRGADSTAQRFKLAARLWSKLPVAVTRFLGPRIRKHISL
jgi:serine/alanine adding enzyme